MSRLLLLFLFLSANAKGAELPPFFTAAPAAYYTLVADTIPPTIECPPSDTVTADPGLCEVQYDYMVNFGDDQPNPILIQLSGLASGSFFQIGATVNSFLVTDLAGNTATCSFTVTVQHFKAAPLQCEDQVKVYMDQNCMAELKAGQALIAPFGCLDFYTVELDKVAPFGNGPWVNPAFSPDDLDKVYMYRIIDPATGNSCFGNVTAKDSIPPVLSCTDITIPCAVLNTTPAYLKDSLGLTAGIPQAPDACGGQVTLNFIDTYSAEDCLTGFTETIRRRWTATDERDNESSCVQNIHLAQLPLSDIITPVNVTLDCSNPDVSLDNTGVPYIEFAGKIFTTLCSVDVDFNDSIVKPCPGSQNYYRIWSYQSTCDGTTLYATQRIDVLDTKGPSVSCDSSLFVMVPGGNCVGELQLPPVSMSDDCSPIVSVEARWSADGTDNVLPGVLSNGDSTGTFALISDFPVYTTVLTYVATDSCGNTGICEMPVTLADTAAPLAMCFPFLYAELSPNGSYALGADTLDLNSNVACGQQLFYKVRRTELNLDCLSGDQFDDAVLFCCSDAGDTIDLVLRVYDIPIPDGPVSDSFAISQSSDCMLKVVITDTLPALCEAPPDISINCNDLDPTYESYGALVPTCAVDSFAVFITSSITDTSCFEKTIHRIFQVFSATGQESQCTQQITINYLQDYYIRFPDDVLVTTCSASGNYGEPEFLYDGCGQLAATYTDEVFEVVPDACMKIERTWLIFNTCTYDTALSVVNIPNPNPNPTPNSPLNLPGPTLSPFGTPSPWAPEVIKIDPLDPAPTDYSSFWTPGANAYQYTQIIKIIDATAPEITCPTATSFGDTTVNDPLLWNQSYWWDSTINSQDLCEGSNPLSITASDSCSGADLEISYLLYLDLDGDNTQETVVSSLNPPAAGTVNFNNYSTPNFAGGTPQIFDGRPVMPNEIYRWAMHESVAGAVRTASVQWKTLNQLPPSGTIFGLPGIDAQLPYGKHRIEWTVRDRCGNEDVCAYQFEIKDTKAPEISCVSGQTINIQAAQGIALTVNNVLTNVVDNCTPITPFSTGPNQIVLSLRKSGSGNGFPLDSADQAVDTLLYSCADLGPQTGELWARDLAGNTSFCTFTVTLADTADVCSPAPDTLTISGALKTETGLPVEPAMVTLGSGTLSLSDLTDQQGVFEFGLPAGSDYTLTPLKNDNPLNGVSTFDLVLISKHILGLDTLDSPYKIIAADANKNNAVTTFDVVELRKLILGIYNELPANTSWRFVDKDFVFPDPFNPFLTTFPETISRMNVQMDMPEEDFVGIKIGDVNNSVMPDSLLVPDDRSAGTLYFDIEDRDITRGETFTVGFESSERVLGYQFTLNHDGLDVVDIQPGTGMSKDNFAVFPDAVTASAENGAGKFAITFRAAKTGRLSDMLGISSRITRAEAYLPAALYPQGEITTLAIALRFNTGAISGPGFELYQNKPNPFTDITTIAFNLPEAGEATLTVYDETGRVLFTGKDMYSKGYNSVNVRLAPLSSGAGMLYYQLKTATHTATKKMLRME